MVGQNDLTVFHKLTGPGGVRFGLHGGVPLKSLTHTHFKGHFARKIYPFIGKNFWNFGKMDHVLGFLVKK